MKIDSKTIDILKNFARIHNSIVVKAGNVLSTITPSKSVLARAKVDTQFKQPFAIYNLNKFIATLSLFNDPDLNFQQKFVTISDSTRKINYTYADESFLPKAPEKELKLPSIDAQFTLKTADLTNVEKALGVLELEEIVFSGDGKFIYIEAAKTSDPTADVYSSRIGETDKTFKAIFNPARIKLIPDDYEVKICAQGFAHFAGSTCDYWIAAEANSTFDK